MPRFEPAPCPTVAGGRKKVLAKASCGYLVVPENRASHPVAPSGSWSRNTRPAQRRSGPTQLSISPADRATSPPEVNGLIAADFIRDRDIYVVSQRGTMFSEPALTCVAGDDFAR